MSLLRTLTPGLGAVSSDAIPFDDDDLVTDVLGSTEESLGRAGFVTVTHSAPIVPVQARVVERFIPGQTRVVERFVPGGPRVRWAPASAPVFIESEAQIESELPDMSSAYGAGGLPSNDEDLVDATAASNFPADDADLMGAMGMTEVTGPKGFTREYGPHGHLREVIGPHGHVRERTGPHGVEHFYNRRGQQTATKPPPHYVPGAASATASQIAQANAQDVMFQQIHSQPASMPATAAAHQKGGLFDTGFLRLNPWDTGKGGFLDTGLFSKEAVEADRQRQIDHLQQAEQRAGYGGKKDQTLGRGDAYGADTYGADIVDVDVDDLHAVLDSLPDAEEQVGAGARRIAQLEQKYMKIFGKFTKCETLLDAGKGYIRPTSFLSPIAALITLTVRAATPAKREGMVARARYCDHIHNHLTQLRQKMERKGIDVSFLPDPQQYKERMLRSYMDRGDAMTSEAPTEQDFEEQPQGPQGQWVSQQPQGPAGQWVVEREVYAPQGQRPIEEFIRTGPSGRVVFDHRAPVRPMARPSLVRPVVRPLARPVAAIRAPIRPIGPVRAPAVRANPMLGADDDAATIAAIVAMNERQVASYSLVQAWSAHPVQTAVAGLAAAAAGAAVMHYGMKAGWY